MGISFLGAAPFIVNPRCRTEVSPILIVLVIMALALLIGEIRRK